MRGGVSKLGKANLCLGHVLGQDVVDVAVLLLLLRLHLLLPTRLEDGLQLLLLLKAELVGVFEEINQLLLGKLGACIGALVTSYH